ncbi:hypothetical protein [Rhodoferax sp.]|uniref:hypothetical protein n=1 Tax=Rhodoferax sp. TaxID=50421 RepID=UPI0025DAA81F|nr:hypothetical protein [Rhodoferax sp.]
MRWQQKKSESLPFYHSKVSGSPFNVALSFGVATMSCFLCGKHRVRSSMATRKFIGKSQAVCAPSCQGASDAEAVAAGVAR